MEKTKLGVSVGLVGALTYFCGLFSGYIITILLAVYVLYCEENLWLKRMAVKSVTLMVAFSLISAIIGFVPNLFDLLERLVNIFGGKFYVAVVDDIISLLQSVLNIAEKILFIILGIKALEMSTVRIAPIDDFLSKHLN